MLFCLLCVLVLLYLCSWKTRQNKTIYLLFFNKHFIFFFCFILFSILQQNPPSLLLKDQTQYNQYNNNDSDVSDTQDILQPLRITLS